MRSPSGFRCLPTDSPGHHAHSERFAFGTAEGRDPGRLYQRDFVARGCRAHGVSVGRKTHGPAADPLRSGYRHRLRGARGQPDLRVVAAGHHDHDHDQGHEHGHQHAHDLNLRSAYIHVVADAATSVLAIVALTGGKLWGAAWLDPVMGLVGAVLVTIWAWGLLRRSGTVPLDAEMDAPVVAEVREAIEQGEVPARLADLHVWRVGRGQYAVAAKCCHLRDCGCGLLSTSAFDP